ncbi:MAG: glycosyltransferase [Oligoflexales bacterium]|nr:glycosyltransferase [Oligoflexales bacterium]
MPIEPLVSIITIFRNEGNFLSDTLSSILKQDYSYLECIMIDGSSSDNSFEIALSYATQDKRFVLYKQKEKGISSAFNEAISKAKGQYLIFLNGGDLFSSEKSLSTLMALAKKNKNNIIACRSEYLSESGQKTGSYIPKVIPKKNDLYWFCSLSHQATLIPIDVVKKIGVYDPQFKIAMDYDFWLRAIQAGFDIAGFRDIVAYHRVGGVSFLNVSQSRKEVIYSRMRNLGFLRLSVFKDMAQFILVILGRGQLWKIGS